MRFLKLAALAVSSLCVFAAIAAFNATTCFAEGESYTFFCGDTSKNCRIVTAERGAAVCGLLLDDVCGESTTYSSLDVKNFLDSVNGEVLFCEELSDSVNLYCSADLPYSVTLYSKEVNLHICIKQDSVTVASPIIFGGY